MMITPWPVHLSRSDRCCPQEAHRFPALFPGSSADHRVRQRQRHQGWLQMLAGIPEFGERQVSSEVADMPSRLLHRVGKGEQPQLVSFARRTGTEETGRRCDGHRGLQHCQQPLGEDHSGQTLAGYGELTGRPEFPQTMHPWGHDSREESRK